MNTPAEAGPGPSTMASSPIVPGTAKQFRIKKRVINLVNPADPGDFSTQSVSPNTSFGEPHRSSTPPVQPTPTVEIQSYTPLGFNKDGVRGILRPSGTPGSGNGVRFFPKNRFRVITPNQSLVTPVAQPPPSPTSNSFLSQLLAVTLPSMSPRKPAPPPEEPSITMNPEESWEQPGQEGEISLVASSVASERSHLISEMDEETEESEPWTGNPEIHCSPLGLPAEMSGDLSGPMELPSAVMQIPEDMSNLLSENFSPPSDMESFSIAEMSRPFLQRGPIGTTLPSIPQSPAVTLSSPSQQDLSMQSDDSVLLNDSNPTIRRRLSPLPRSPLAKTAPETPMPTTAKPFTSIFADMSAEQADLSWPLTRRASPTKSDTDDDTAFHSAVFANLTGGDLVDAPVMNAVVPCRLSNNSAGTPGNATEFFDCASPTPSPSLPSHTSSGDTMLSRTPSPFGPVHLAKPTKALFDAHSAHTTAMLAELDLYRSLASKLQVEVAERDGALADLNLRVIEGEVWRTRVEELEKERRDSGAEKTVSRLARQSSASPSPKPVQIEHPGDRTTAAEASSRDLEIRLAKALSDQEMLTTQLAEIQESKAQSASELTASRQTIRKMEERERDAVVSAQKGSEELRNQLEAVTRRERALHAQLKETRVELERAETEVGDANARTEDVEQKMRHLKIAKDNDEEEIGKLATMLDELRAAQGEDEDLKGRLEELEHELDDEVRERQHLQGELKVKENDMAGLKKENEQLEHELQETKAKLLAHLNTPVLDLSPEVARLRAESASKDLKILNLQRRKMELKEDLEMLNIALDSKQQELELIKRRFSVKGVAGCTPLASSKKINAATPSMSEIETPAPGKSTSTSMGTRRKSSMAFVTPSMGSDRNPRMMKSSQMLERRTSGRRTSTMGKVEEENRPPVENGSLRSVRRERMLA